MKRRFLIADFFLNLIILLSAFIAIGEYFWGEPDIFGKLGIRCFRYLTILSPTLAFITSGAWMVFIFQGFGNPYRHIPLWIIIFRFVGAVSTTLTFVMVVFFLAPMAGIHNGIAAFGLWFKGNAFSLHFLIPVLNFVSLMFFDDTGLPTFVRSAAITPVIAYTIIYLQRVWITQTWPDFYGLTFGGQHLFGLILASLVLIGISYAISLFMLKLKNRLSS